MTDYSPSATRAQRAARASAITPADVPVHEVDARNVVPAWAASDKLEYAARTIRRKITDALPAYLTPFPSAEAFERAAANAVRGPRGRSTITEFRAYGALAPRGGGGGGGGPFGGGGGWARSSSGDGGFGPAPSVVVGPRAIARRPRGARGAGKELGPAPARRRDRGGTTRTSSAAVRP